MAPVVKAGACHLRPAELAPAWKWRASEGWRGRGGQLLSQGGAWSGHVLVTPGVQGEQCPSCPPRCWFCSISTRQENPQAVAPVRLGWW